MQDYDITITVMHDDNATVAEISDMYSGAVLATGSSKRMPGDPRNAQLGINLAMARAFENAAQFLTDHAECGAHIS